MNPVSNPAKYRNVIVFEEFSSYQNDAGHWVDDWIESELGEFYAQIRTIRGNEFILAGAQQAKVSARINIRYRPDVEKKYYELEKKMRIKYIHPKTKKERIFHIVYMNNLEEQNIELEFIVNEVR